MLSEKPVHPILQKLAGTDRRAIGNADEVAQEIVEEPELFDAVFSGMFSNESVLRMRAADAVEKASRQRPELLQPYKERLLHGVAAVHQQEVRWHVAQMLPRLRLDAGERAEAVSILESFLRHESKIVAVNAMQALADLALEDEQLHQTLIPKLEHFVQAGSPAVKARARKLLQNLSAEDAA